MVSSSTPCSIFALPSRSWIWGLAASLRWIDEIRKPPPLLLFSVSFSPYYKNTPSSPKTLDRVPLHSLGLHFGPVPAPHLQLPVQRRRRPSSDAPRGGAPIATPAFRLFLSRLSESVCRSLSNPRRLWSEILDRSSSSRPESPPMPHPASTRTLPTSASTTSPSSLPPSPSPSLGLLPACRAPLFCLSLLISNLLLPPISPDRSMSPVKLLRCQP